MPVDYAALARKFGGSVAEDAPDYSGLIPMRPMVAHAPRAQAVDYAALAKKFGGQEVSDAGTLDEEMRTPSIGIDPRLEPESMMNEAQAAEVPGQILGGMADYAAMATAHTMMSGARAIVTGAARSRLRPIVTGAAIGGGTAAMTGHDIASGILTGAVAGAANMPAAAAKVAAEEAAPDAAALLRVARSASATSAERNAARVALQKMGWVPDAVASEAAAVETAAPAVAKPVPLPAGQTKLPTVSSPTPVQGPKPLTEMQIVTRGRQEEAAKAAGLDIGEVFGGKAAKTVSRGAQAAAQHKALMSFGREVAKRNPKVGEKIWVLLDESGSPVKALTPGEAGAAARKGLKTTWVKNLWTN